MGTFYRSRHELIFAFKNGAGAAYQQFRTRPARSLPNERLAISRRQHPEGRPARRACSASDGQAGGDDRRRDQGRLAARRHRARSLRRLRLDADRRSQDRPARAAVRARSRLLRPHSQSLGDLRQGRRRTHRLRFLRPKPAALERFASRRKRSRLGSPRHTEGRCQMSDDRKIRLELPGNARITRWGMASRLRPLDLSLDVQAIQGVDLEARAIRCRLSTKND